MGAIWGAYMWRSEIREDGWTWGRTFRCRRSTRMWTSILQFIYIMSLTICFLVTPYIIKSFLELFVYPHWTTLLGHRHRFLIIRPHERYFISFKVCIISKTHTKIKLNSYAVPTKVHEDRIFGPVWLWREYYLITEFISSHCWHCWSDASILRLTLHASLSAKNISELKTPLLTADLLSYFCFFSCLTVTQLINFF